MSKTALEAVMSQAHVRKRVAQAIHAALMLAQEPGGSDDDVAGCLLRWKDGCVREAVMRREAAWERERSELLGKALRLQQHSAVLASARINDVDGQLTFHELVNDIRECPAPF